MCEWVSECVCVCVWVCVWVCECVCVCVCVVSVCVCVWWVSEWCVCGCVCVWVCVCVWCVCEWVCVWWVCVCVCVCGEWVCVCVVCECEAPPPLQEFRRCSAALCVASVWSDQSHAAAVGRSVSPRLFSVKERNHACVLRESSGGIACVSAQVRSVLWRGSDTY